MEEILVIADWQVQVGRGDQGLPVVGVILPTALLDLAEPREEMVFQETKDQYL